MSRNNEPAKKANLTPSQVSKAMAEDARRGNLNWATATAQAAEGLKSVASPGSHLTRTVKAMASGDLLPPITSTLGRTIRDDRVNFHAAQDTHKRLEIDMSVMEAAANLRSRKTRPPTRDEIEQITQKNARGTEDIVGIMRAQRLINEGKL